jgi:hypothetical protein
MPLNPDQVRVDLLRIKRKLYLSYPEGSKERQDFLLGTKLAELTYLQGMIVPSAVDPILGEYARKQAVEYMDALFYLFAGVFSSAILLACRHFDPRNVWYRFWYLPIILWTAHANRPISRLIVNWRRLQPFKRECAKISKKVQKLMKEIHDLSKNGY